MVMSQDTPADPSHAHGGEEEAEEGHQEAAQHPSVPGPVSVYLPPLRQGLLQVVDLRLAPDQICL